MEKELKEEKEEYFKNIRKQIRNFEGQKSLLEELRKNPLVDLRLTPLKQSEGEIYKKGVDVLLAIDLVHLARTLVMKK